MKTVERDPSSGVYRPGICLLQMAFLALDNNNLGRLVAPFLHELCSQYRENVNLSVMDDTDVVYVDIVESSQRVKLAAVPGQPEVNTAVWPAPHNRTYPFGVS